MTIGEKLSHPQVAMIVLMSSCIASCIDFNFTGACRYETVGEAANPSGEVTSSVVIENCGATSGLATLVVLRTTAAGPERTGGDRWVASYPAKPKIELRWLGEKQLLVVASAYRRRERGNDLEVQVVYKDLGVED